MNNNQSLAIIEKLISKTKNNSIRWKQFSSSGIKLKPLPASPLDDVLIAPLPNSRATQFDSDNSYICSYDGGVFALLLYHSMFDNDIFLRVQTPNSFNSKNYASTNSNDDAKEVAQLKRLYNLVHTACTSLEIDSFIDTFLRSE